MRKLSFIFLFALMTFAAHADHYLLNGGQDSQINYEMIQKVEAARGTEKLILSYVIPESYSSPTYNQKVSDFDLEFSSSPSKREEDIDKRGNKVIRAIWQNPSGEMYAKIKLAVVNSTKLSRLGTDAPFPLKDLPKDIRDYLQDTEQVPSKDAKIRTKADELTQGSKTEFDAVQKILTWVVDHMHYVLLPQSYNAMYSFETGKGNCQNYSHLTAALLRAVNIPARIVNGVTLKEPYDIKTGDGVMTLRMAQGRHSWIEVYFPDLGWVPFDPQQTELFVSNRFIRVEVGLDNNETKNDGLIRWTESKNAGGMPKFEEAINSEFVNDQVNFTAAKQDYGPRVLLFSPQVDAAFTKPVLEPPPPPPTALPPADLKTAKFIKKFIFGNLEFPENMDFLSTRGPAEETASGDKEMRKNFLVETAEYVTTQGKQYAQTFILQKPVQLENVGLALHNFGGQGQLWIELFRDTGSGMPGEQVATSDFLQLSQIPPQSGYAWVDFLFSGNPLILQPGRYWIAFGFTGSPIINWFFTYGKPVGPADGTRYKTIFDETWSRSLSFEFNYRIVGLTTE